MIQRNLIVGAFMSILSFNTQASSKLITHQESNQSTFDLSPFKKTLQEKKDRTLTLEEEMTLLEQLAQFELGRFLLINKGLNGYWTSYIIIYGLREENLSPLENWILHHAPSVKATQERYTIFKETLQNHLQDNMTIASIPCGLMDDLLTLEYGDVKNVRLVGVDLDNHSLSLAKENAKKSSLKKVDFLKKDAWRLNVQEEYDIITSNGLNIYEPEDDKVTDLYKQFYNALKKGGKLIISFLTPPPALSKESTWKNINAQDALKQKVIFSDIIGAAWQAFRTESLTRTQLEKAGFHILEVIYDSQGIFPTVIAKKK